MRKLIFSALFVLSFLSVSGYAQRTYRLKDLAGQLQRGADDLASGAYDNFTRRSNNSRSDVDALLAAQQISASAGVFSRMVNDNRRSSELRDAAASISDLARRAAFGASSNIQLREVQQTLDNISREISGAGGGNSGGDYNNGGSNDRPIVGNVSWKGTVDDVVRLTIRNNSLELKTISGTPYSNNNYNFTSPLPNRRVDVEIDKKKGRGTVRVMQQPRRENNFTTVIEIRDTSGGAKDYELEIYWR
jgi:hypothetical protein